ncbi:MAG: glycoside hydrolase family 2 protein [Gaiellaceae bacterium]
MSKIGETELTSTDRGVPRAICLDGTWEFIPGDDPSAPATSIEVPGLWEAAGHTALDGVVRYRRTFELAETDGRWSLVFGAVMDEAEVFLNGMRVGAHEGAFTPFAFDVSDLVRTGDNELTVRVVDYAGTDDRHRMTAHGKQGWMNDVFPSPPSLYMTYGGIWQSVTLERHGNTRIENAWINSNPDDLIVEVELQAVADTVAEVELALLDDRFDRKVELGEGTTKVVFELGKVDAAHWSPSSPVLHHARLVVNENETRSHERSFRFGLRKVGLTQNGLLIDDQPITIQSALVQGFRADTLYAEGSRAAIEAEVLAAKHAGLNMLRLHIKAFDPQYLDVCDELGMLVHCDIPVAEPIAHALLGADGEVADACAQTAREHVRRDRNHPSIMMWSAMNELGVDDLDSRTTRGYEGFARRLYAAVSENDPTRPVIENDWIEPDPVHVFCSPLLTSHWYGRLSASYLRDLRAKTASFAAGDRPLFVSEFGDWGLPDLDRSDNDFWAYGEQLGGVIDESAWSGNATAFVEGTQRYQGLADRLQIEIFRSTEGVVGWCLTELTDVPQEFNGLFDLHRNPKRAAVDEIARACQPVLPVVRRTSWTIGAGEAFEDEVVIVNDGPALDGCRLNARLGNQELDLEIGVVEAHSVTGPIAVRVDTPQTTGPTQLELSVEDERQRYGANQYPLHVVAAASISKLPLKAIVGDSALERALGQAGVDTRVGDGNLLLVSEGALDENSAAIVAQSLQHGRNVLLLAQPATASDFLPIPAAMTDLTTQWGSTPFIFTTDIAGLASLPTETVLTTEILEVTPDAVLTSLGGGSVAVETVVGVLKPPPEPVLGTVVGRLPVGEGWLTVCQLPLIESVAAGSALAVALLRELAGYAEGIKGGALR